MVAGDVPVAGRLRRRVDRHGKGALHPHRRGEQFAPHADERRGGKGALAAAHEAANDLGLAPGLMSWQGDPASLMRPDARDDLGALDQQVLQPIVDLVDAAAQQFEIGDAVRHCFNSLPGAG